MREIRNFSIKKFLSLARPAAIGLLLFISLLALGQGGLASTPAPARNKPFLLSVYFKAGELKNMAEQAIARLEIEIQKNRDTAARARQLMELAAGRSDENARRAEQTAARALRLAEESQARNEQSLAEWKMRKARAEKSMSAVMGLLTSASGGGENILGSVTDISGQAEIQKKDGSSRVLNAETPGFLESGDRMKTTDGRAEVQLLGGRAAAKLDRNSELEVLGDSSEEQSFELLRGRFHGLVEKTDGFLARLKQGMEAYQEDLSAIKDLFTDDELRADVEKRLKLHFRAWEQGQFETYRKVIAVICVRGTEFAVRRFEDGGWELWVLEGEVEVTLPGNDRVIPVKAGYKCAFQEAGLTEPVLFDSIDKWWEK